MNVEEFKKLPVGTVLVWTDPDNNRVRWVFVKNSWSVICVGGWFNENKHLFDYAGQHIILISEDIDNMEIADESIAKHFKVIE